MNEAQRQFVMGVAGVRLWYARGSLPGAAPSPDFDFGEPEQAEATVEPAAIPVSAARPRRPTTDASRKGLARLQGLLAETGAQAASETNKKGVVDLEPESGPEAAPAVRETVQQDPQPVPVSEQTPIEEAGDVLAGKAIGFHWRFWIGNHWLLVSSCPDAASRALEDRLAANILRALGEGAAETEALHWPVFSNPAVPGNDAAGAVEVVAAMADAVRRPKQLWLGLEPDGADPEVSALWRHVSAPLGDATVSFPGSLAALSSDPGAKRALWQALQHARRP